MRDFNRNPIKNYIIRWKSTYPVVDGPTFTSHASGDTTVEVEERFRFYHPEAVNIVVEEKV